MTRKRIPRNAKIERAEIDYLEALEAGDLERLAEMWEAAESDPALSDALCMLSRDLNDETDAQRATFEQDAATVREAAAATFAPRAAAEPADVYAPVTAKDVALRIKQDIVAGKRRLSPQDQTALDALIQSGESVPTQFTQSAFENWTKELGVSAGKHCVEALKDVARKLSAARSQRTEAAAEAPAHMLAARPAASRARKPAAPNPGSPVSKPQDEAGPQEQKPDAP